MSEQLENYDVVFDVLMPGASRKTQYTITVQADNRVNALAMAEAKWSAITGTYDIRVNSVGKKSGE